MPFELANRCRRREATVVDKFSVDPVWAANQLRLIIDEETAESRCQTIRTNMTIMFAKPLTDKTRNMKISEVMDVAVKSAYVFHNYLNDSPCILHKRSSFTYLAITNIKQFNGV